MAEAKARFPFEVPFHEVQTDIDRFVSAVFSSLESEFLVLPRGEGFVEYPVFETGYEELKRATGGFSKLNPGTVLRVAIQVPISLIVLRTMLGFTPPEWAYVAAQRTAIEIDQGFIRNLDREIRKQPLTPLQVTSISAERLRALVDTACALLTESAPEVREDEIHRLDKADTRAGLSGISTLARMGVPYAVLLYERFLGRPFAGHRDSVSELIGDRLELAVEEILNRTGISYRKTKRAERIPGFDQAPDFIVPSEFNPQVVIEAKSAEDDGTARDKVTRIQHLHELSIIGQPSNQARFELVACIGGRGFGVRREDMKKLLLATRGKVFTVKTLDKLIDYTRLREFASK